MYAGLGFHGKRKNLMLDGEFQTRRSRLNLIAPDWQYSQNRQNRGYTVYPQGILVKSEICLKDISEISPLVQALTQKHHQAWFIYPREAETIVDRFSCPP